MLPSFLRVCLVSSVISFLVSLASARGGRDEEDDNDDDNDNDNDVRESTPQF